MARPVTLFTGQWADLPLDDLAAKASQWGFDGLELACWGDHFEVDQAVADSGYAKAKREQLGDLGCWALGAHLVGQAVSDPIDARHQGILPPEVWGDGDPAGVQERAAERMKDTARAAAAFGVTQVNGFTGSPIWHMLYTLSAERLRRDRARLRARGRAVGADPGRVRCRGRALRARGAPDRDRLRLRDDAEDARGDRTGARRSGSTSTRRTSSRSCSTRCASSRSSPTASTTCTSRTRKVRTDGRRSILGSHLNFGEGERGWDFVSPGHGDVEFEELFRALNRIGYEGPLSIEWEDSGMNRELGAQDALAFVRRYALQPLRRGLRRGDAAMSSLTGSAAARPRRGTSRRSASGCSGTPSWARRTRTR